MTEVSNISGRMLAQRLMIAFEEVFNEVVKDWEDVYYGADPEEETEVWSRTDEAKERGFKRLEVIARGEADPKIAEVEPEEATYEEVEWCIQKCEIHMPMLDRKRARQLLQRFIDFDDLQWNAEDYEGEDDAEMAVAMSVVRDNSIDSQRSGVARDEIFAVALYEILRKERHTMCAGDTGEYYNRDLMNCTDQRGWAWALLYSKESK